MKQKFSKDRVFLRIKSLGYTLKDSIFEFSDKKTKFHLICNKGHDWYTTLPNLMRSQCSKCAVPIRAKKRMEGANTIGKFEQYVLAKNGTFSPVYFKNGIYYSNISCANNHSWPVSIHAMLKTKSWCMECYREKTREKNFESKMLNLKNYASSQNGIVLSTMFHTVNDREFSFFQCNNGHIWQSDIDLMLSKKCWCKECFQNLKAGQSQKTNANLWNRVLEHANKMGGMVISPESDYKNSKSKLEFKCKVDSHDSWVSGIGTVVNRKSWCKECSSIARGESIVRKWLEIIFEKKFVNTRPLWNVNPYTKQPLELDCYNEELKIAVEYNGKQHYNDKNTFHKTRRNLVNQIKRDLIKHANCQKFGIKLYVIKDPEKNLLINFEKFFKHLTTQLKNQGLILSLSPNQIDVMCKIHEDVIHNKTS